MRYVALTVLALSMANVALAQGPGRGEMEIKEVTANGSGCPVGTVYTVLEPSDPNGPLDTVLLTNEGLVVDDNSRKFCNVAVDIKFPAGWSYTVDAVQTRGYAKIQDGVKATVATEVSFRGSSKKAKGERNQSGYWEGDFFLQEDDFTDVVWSPCGKVLPINIKTEFKLRGDNSEGLKSTITSSKATEAVEQKFTFRWRRCNP